MKKIYLIRSDDYARMAQSFYAEYISAKQMGKQIGKFVSYEKELYFFNKGKKRVCYDSLFAF